MSKNARLHVFVEAVDTSPVEDAAVHLASRNGGGSHELEKTESPGMYGPVAVEPGAYELQVEAGGKLKPESVNIKVGEGEQRTIPVVLAAEGKPFYYAQETRIYFEREDDAFLLTARGPKAPQLVAQALKRSKLKFETVPSPSGEPGGNADKSGDETLVLVRAKAGEIERQIKTTVRRLEAQELTVIPALPIRRGEDTVEGLTAELVVRFDESVTEEQAVDIARELGLRIERSVAYAGNAYLMSRPQGPSYELLDIAQKLREGFPVRYAEPNLLYRVELDQFTPNDTLYANQTFHPLINSDDAWETLANIDPNIRGGSANLTIAVFDGNGVAPNHPDLTGNLTDGTAKLVTSFNFVGMAAQTVAGLSGDHGTQCAGSATARINNNQGIAGVAGNCHLIGARSPSSWTGIEMADAFIWAAGFNTGNTNPAFPALPARPADVISNSWGVANAALSAIMRDCFDFLTVYGRGGRGCVVTFSTGNLGYVQFSNIRRFASYERTIAVGASINVNPTNPTGSSQGDPNGNMTNLTATVDRRTFFNPYGPEMDIVAPSHTAYNPGLIDPITSAFRVGTGGLDGCPGATTCSDYDASFGGTSHSSPCVAGAAALVLSVRPSLSWVEVREILRDSAVRIDAGQTNTIGQWQDLDGDGVAEFSQWYGYGRLDVDAAVRRARDLAATADIVVRENLSDTGAVPSGGWHAHSPDIWTRRADDPIPALAYGSDPPHQSPRRGQDNYVYCRVRNVGTAASNQIYVRAMFTHYPGFEFRYPQEFTPTNRPGDPLPNPIRPGTYLIGEQRINALGAGVDQIVKMTWASASIPPEEVTVSGTLTRWHPCLLLEASPHDGPMPAGATFDVKRDNNIAQRNIDILDPSEPASDSWSAIVAGTSEDSGVEWIVVDRSRLDLGTLVYVHVPDRKLFQLMLRRVRSKPEDGGRGRGRFERVEETAIRLLDATRLEVERGGGRPIVIETPAGARIRPDASQNSALRVVQHLGVQAVEVGPGKGVVELPLRLRAGEFTPVLFALGGPEPSGELRLSQRLGSGELSAGFTMLAGKAEA